MRKIGLMLILALVLIAGCQGGDDNNAGTGTFTGGAGGVGIKFVELAPPKTFDEGNNVAVKVLLINNGEYDLAVGEAKAKVYGVNLDNFGLAKEYKSTPGALRGVGEFNTEGGQEEIDFGNAKYALPVINSEEFVLRARVCYPYQTRVLSEVCVANAASTSEACSLDGEKIKQGDVSSGPIQVSSLKEQTRGSSQVRFDLTVENKGGGEVYNPSVSCEELDEEVFRMSNANKLKLEIVNPVSAKCDFKSGEPSNAGIVELKNGKGVVSCWMDVNDEAYSERMSLKLEYMYRDDTMTNVRIFEKN